MRAIACIGLVAVVFAVAAVSCGGPEPIGQQPCTDPLGADGGGVFAYSPALECASHICLVEYGLAPTGFVAVCTRECSSDGDCDTAERIECAAGYGCGEIGGYPHAVCVCRALLDGGTR